MNFKDVPFELWEIKKYSNGTVSLNQHQSSSKESIQKIDGNKNSVIKNVGKEVKSYDESDHTSKSNKSLIDNWNRLKEKFIEMEGVETVPKKRYITLMYGSKTVWYCTFRKEKIWIECVRGNILLDGSNSRNFFTMDDPKKISDEYSWTWKNSIRKK